MALVNILVPKAASEWKTLYQMFHFGKQTCLCFFIFCNGGTISKPVSEMFTVSEVDNFSTSINPEIYNLFTEFSLLD
jgi:hypothetical protein